MDLKLQKCSVVIKKENIDHLLCKNESEASLNTSESLANHRNVKSEKAEHLWYARACFLCEGVCENSQMSFHKFPEETKACSLWKKACNLTDRDDVSDLNLCSNHFRSEDFVDSGVKQISGVIKLKPGTLPSVNVPVQLATSETPDKCCIVANKDSDNSTLKTKAEGANVVRSTRDRMKDDSPVTPMGMVPIDTIVKEENLSDDEVSMTDHELANTVHDEGRLPVLNPSVETVPFGTTVKTKNLTDCAVSSDVDMSDNSFMDDKNPPNSIRIVRAKNQREGTITKTGNRAADFVVKTRKILSRYLETIPVTGFVKSDVTVSGSVYKPVPFSSVVSSCDLATNTSAVPNPFTKCISNTILTKETNTYRKNKLSFRKIICPNLGKGVKVANMQPRVVLKRLSEKEIKKYQNGLYSEQIKKERCTKMSRYQGGETTIVKKSYKYCYLCGLRDGCDSSVALHKFPCNPDTCKEWKEICALHQSDKVASLRICSRHFSPEDFLNTNAKKYNLKLRLKSGAVPSRNVPYQPSIEGLTSEFEIKNEPMDPPEEIDPANLLESAEEIDPANLLEPAEEIDPANLLEVIVNECSPRRTFTNKEREPQYSVNRSNKTGRSCFLCHFKEGSDAETATVLHEFPKDAMVCDMWKQVCNLLDHDYIKASSLFICSNHFVAEDYTSGGLAPVDKPVLNPKSVPSVAVPNPLKPILQSALQSIESGTATGLKFVNPMNPMGLIAGYSSSVRVNGVPRIDNTRVNSAYTNVFTNPLSTNEVLTVDNSRLGTAYAGVVNGPIGTKEVPRLENLRMDPNFVPSATPTYASVPRFLMPIEMPRVGDPQNVTPIVKTDPKDNAQNKNVNVVIKTNPMLMAANFNNMSASNRISKSIAETAFPNSVYIGHNVGVQQTKKSGYVSPSMQQMPALQLALRPPGVTGVLFQNKYLKRAVKTKATQTTPTLRVAQSCQTEVVCEYVTFNDKVLRTDFAVQPVNKKSRLSPEEPNEKQMLYRMNKHFTTLRDLLNHLQKKNLLSKDAADVLMCSLSVNCQKLVSKKLQTKGLFVWSMRAFALSLHAYSIDAYNYVHNHWPNLVPNYGLIKPCLAVENGMPGFSKEVFEAFSRLSMTSKNRIMCNITICEMPLREQILFENDRFYGGVDLGTNQATDNDDIVAAQNVLVFFVSALNSSWSIPVGYFLIRSLNSEERANLLRNCLDLLHEKKMRVLSITLDGSPVNTNMCCHFGANFCYDDGFHPSFLNPVTHERMYVFFDPCCMMLMVRNTLGDKGTLFDAENKPINWSFISQLNRVQSLLPWDMDTKLTEDHVNYQSNRTDLKICLQTLSRSVYKATMNMIEKKIEGFEKSYPTSVFCLMFNNIFDMLNCRNKLSKKIYRLPIIDENLGSLKNNARVFLKYICSLKDSAGIPILTSSRKTGFLGFIVSLSNIFDLYEACKAIVGLDCLLTQKLSLDYARTFFSTVRRGSSGLLNAKEFELMYRKLVLKNCRNNLEEAASVFQTVDILRVCGEKQNYVDPICNYKERVADTTDYDVYQSLLSLKFIVDDDIKYICGFVVNKILNQKLCIVCAEHLVDVEDVGLLLKNKIDPQSLVASRDVWKICKAAEEVLGESREAVGQNVDLNFLVTKTFCRVGEFVFNTNKMKVHLLEQSVFDNHLSQLCKLVAETFLEILLFQESVV